MYNCPRCGYLTKHKGNMKTHIHRKNICEPLINDVDVLKLEMEILINKKIKKTHKCETCDKMFSRSNNLKRHQTKCQEKSKEDILLNKIEELTQQLTEAKKDISPQNITINIQNNYNLTINEYNDPNVDHLKDINYKRCFNGDYFTPNIALANKIYCQPKLPENHGIIIPNKSKNEFKICEGDNKFIIKDGDIVAKKVLETSDYYLNDKINQWILENINKKERGKYDQYLAKKEDPDFVKQEIRELRNLFINKRSVIKETHKKLGI